MLKKPGKPRLDAEAAPCFSVFPRPRYPFLSLRRISGGGISIPLGGWAMYLRWNYSPKRWGRYDLFMEITTKSKPEDAA